MRRIKRSARGVLVVVPVLVALLLVAYVLIGGPTEQWGMRTGITASLLAIVGALTPAVVWAWNQRRAKESRPDPEQLRAAADLLAERSLTSWSAELVRQGMGSPAPVRVRWRWGSEDVALPRGSEALLTRRSGDPPPLPSTGGAAAEEVLGSGLVTRLYEEVYARLRHGRLVLLGGPGAGKTAAMTMLLVEALRVRREAPDAERARMPVPVWLPMTSWRADRESLAAWVSRAMLRDHPYLAARDLGPGVPTALMENGAIALFLDGLDEMPQDHRARAMERLLHESTGFRVTLTSRPEQYAALAAAGRALTDAVVIDLVPVAPGNASRYLLDGQLGGARRGWEEAAVRLRDDPDGVLATTLNSPLMLSLARAAYADRDPRALLDPGLTTSEQAEERLLDQLVRTAYPEPREHAQAVRWLGWTADRMSRHAEGRTSDLRWWDIPTWTTSGVRQVVAAAVGGGAYAVVLLATSWVVAYAPLAVSGEDGLWGRHLAESAVLATVPLMTSLLVALAVTVVLGQSGGKRASCGGGPGVRTGFATVRTARAVVRAGAAWLAAALVLMPLSAGVDYVEAVSSASDDEPDLALASTWADVVSELPSLISMSLLYAAPLAVMLAWTAVAGEQPRQMILRRPTRRDLRATGLGILAGGAPIAALPAVAWLVFVGPDLAAGDAELDGDAASVILLLAVAVAALVCGALIGALLWLLRDVWGHPVSDTPDASPFRIYRRDARARVVSAVVSGALGGLVVAVPLAAYGALIEIDEDPMTWSTMSSAYVGWLGVAWLLAGVLFAVVGALRSGASPLLLATEVASALRGQPVRFLRLYEQARERQLLRQAGAVYQFRHARLQDHLARTYRADQR